MGQVVPVILSWSNSHSSVTTSAQKSGHFSCILFDFSATQDTNYSFFLETLPSSDSAVPHVAESPLLALQVWPPSAPESMWDCFRMRASATFSSPDVFSPKATACIYVVSVIAHTTSPVNCKPHFSELGPSDPCDIKKMSGGQKMSQVWLIQAKCTFPSNSVPS